MELHVLTLVTRSYALSWTTIIVLRSWYDYTFLNGDMNPSSKCRYTLTGCQTKIILNLIV